jgi:hypothetical protein
MSNPSRAMAIGGDFMRRIKAGEPIRFAEVHEMLGLVGADDSRSMSLAVRKSWTDYLHGHGYVEDPVNLVYSRKP